MYKGENRLLSQLIFLKILQGQLKRQKYTMFYNRLNTIIGLTWSNIEYTYIYHKPYFTLRKITISL